MHDLSYKLRSSQSGCYRGRGRGGGSPTVASNGRQMRCPASWFLGYRSGKDDGGISPVRYHHSAQVILSLAAQSERPGSLLTMNWQLVLSRGRSYGCRSLNCTARWARPAGTATATVTRFRSGKSGLDAADARKMQGNVDQHTERWGVG